MKAAFVIPNLTHGGIQTQVYMLAKHFKDDLRFDVTVYGLNGKDDAFVEHLKTQAIDCVFRPELGAMIQGYEEMGALRKWLTWMKIWLFMLGLGHVILLPFTKPIDTFVNTIWRFTRVKLSFSFERGGHTNPTPNRSSFVNWLRKASKPVYVSNSFHGKQAMHIVKGVPLSQIHVIRNGFRLNSETSGNQLTHDFGFPKDGRKVVTMVANFFPEKDHLFVLEALAKSSLADSLIIIFAGLGAGEVCRTNFERAKKRTSELRLDNSVFFLGRTEGVKELLEQSDIGLLATRSEGCPNAILEYMGSSLPILATRIPGIQEVVPQANQDFLFTRGEHEEFIERLTRLVSDSALRAQLGSENLNHVRAEFNPQRMFDAYYKILEDKRLVARRT